MKPNLFIGSSTENIEIAEAIQIRLEHDSVPAVWNQGIFTLTSNALDDLTTALEKSDFGVFVLTPNDITRLREKEYQTTRDNVLFELGLFIGKLGKARTFIVLPRSRANFRLPTDLLGVNPAEYDAAREDNNIDAALGPACAEIRKRIKSLGIRSDRLAGTALGKRPLKEILCLSTEPYENLGIEQDIKILNHNFPGIVTEKRRISLRDFRDSLMPSTADILHIVLNINPNTGAFLFPKETSLSTNGGPESNFRGGSPPSSDELAIDGFVQLVQAGKPALVILPTCHAVYPASKLVSITNVIGAAGDIPVPTIVSWCEWFYRSLKAGNSIAKSFDLAKASSGANMSLFIQKDIVFSTQ